MVNPFHVAALFLASAVTAQTVVLHNPAPTRNATWVEVALPRDADNPDHVNLVDGERRWGGTRVFRSRIADHYAVLCDLQPHERLVAELEPRADPIAPLVLHPDIHLTQVLPIVVDVVRPDGTTAVLSRVPIDGQDLVVVENNAARLVLQARYSNGQLHSDCWAYVHSLHPAVRFQVEMHYSDIGGAEPADTYPARNVRFRWPNAPSSVSVFSDVAALEGWRLMGSEFTWEPPFRPKDFTTTPRDVPPRMHVLGHGERILFDGVLIFGRDPAYATQRDAARYGPVVGVAEVWDGQWSALGGLPPAPADHSVDIRWTIPGNIYSSRWNTVAMTTNMSGSQAGFGNGGLAPAVSLRTSQNVRPCRLTAVDEAMRPAFFREANGAPVTVSDHWPATQLHEGLPVQGFYGSAGWTKNRTGQSGRRYYDDEHIRHRDLSSFLHLAVDYQLRSVARQLWQIDAMNKRVAAGWYGSPRNGGRRMLSAIEVGRLFDDLDDSVVAYCGAMHRHLVGSWEAANVMGLPGPAPRELVLDVSDDPRNGCNPPAWAPWEQARAAAGAYAGYRYCLSTGNNALASQWRQRAFELSRTVCMVMREQGGRWRIPYRVTYAGGVRQIPAGWMLPDADTVNWGRSDWFLWGFTALQVFMACQDMATDGLDQDLLETVQEAMDWQVTSRPPLTWEDSHWLAGVGR